MPGKRLLIFMGIGVALVGGVVLGVFSGTKGNHLELKGRVIKARTGALDEKTSVAVLDFRIENPSDVRFVVRDVKVTLEKENGEKLEGRVASKPDLKTLFQYNRFLGDQYNDGLAIKDEVPKHGRMDRMVAVSFELPLAEMEDAKALALWIQDMDGAEFETAYKLKEPVPTPAAPTPARPK